MKPAERVPRQSEEELLDGILAAIGALRELQRGGHHISQMETQGLRRALECWKAVGGDACGGRSRTVSRRVAAADGLLGGVERYVAQRASAATLQTDRGRSAPGAFLHSLFFTPLERRVQTLLVLLLNFFTGPPLCLALMGVLLFCRYTAPLVVTYVVFLLATAWRPRFPLAKKMGFVRCGMWRYYRDYFPVRLVVPRAVRRRLDPLRGHLFVYHPHGVHSFGALINFGLDVNDTSRLLPGLRVHLQTLRVNFFMPLWCHMARWMGCGDASVRSIQQTLRAGGGESVLLVVGGAEESTMAVPHTNDLVLLKRKGFIKIALQEGCPLVPVYGFGENNLYRVAPWAARPPVQRMARAVRRLVGFAPPLFVGRGLFSKGGGLLPQRCPIVVVVGEPLTMPRIADPTAADVQHWQARYIEALQRLYEKYRDIYDVDNAELCIIK